MKDNAFQKCIIPNCGETYSLSPLRTRCGKCGNLLDVVYREHPNPRLKAVFRDRREGRSNLFDESGVWRFRELINFPGVDCDDVTRCSRILVTLYGMEGRTRPLRCKTVADYMGVSSKNSWLQFEGENPTASFKDNGMATAFTHAKMIGVKRVACASTGNTSSSAAAFAAKEGLRAVIFIGEGRIAGGKLAQTLDYGASVVKVKGDFDDAMEILKELAECNVVYPVNSINAFRLEGQKTIIYRVLDFLDWEVPDWIVLPGGNLGNTSAFGKALKELYDWGWVERMPRLAVINAEGANTLYRLFNEYGLRWNEGRISNHVINEYYTALEEEGVKAETKASAIEILKPVNLTKALRSLYHTDGVVEQVSDREMLDARAVVGRTGLGCELASAATVAGVKKLVSKNVIKGDESIVGVLTGHMLKDTETIISYHSNPRNLFSNTARVVEKDIQSVLKTL